MDREEEIERERNGRSWQWIGQKAKARKRRKRVELKENREEKTAGAGIKKVEASAAKFKGKNLLDFERDGQVNIGNTAEAEQRDRKRYIIHPHTSRDVHKQREEKMNTARKSKGEFERERESKRARKSAGLLAT